MTTSALPLFEPSAAPGPRGALPADRALPADVIAADGVDGAYIHVPFCRHKCHYCDFYSFVDRDDRQDAFASRLIAEIESVAPRWRRPLETIFVGGGTPTLLPPRIWQSLLPVLARRLPLAPGGEFTVEANPETVSAELAEVLADGGVTRVSLGAQSFDRRHLATLERRHDPASVERSVDVLRRAGIREVNLDLIFGIPGQRVEEWLRDLDLALALRPDHVSAYGLTYEPGTAMTMRLKLGEFTPADDEIEAAMFEATADRLAEAGFERYEISNFARRDALGARRCRHNMLYWTNRDWWAFGPSASGHVRGVRWKNVPRLGDWLACSPWSPVIDVERLDARGVSGERIMLGLRLSEGIEAIELEGLLAVGKDAPERRAAFARQVAAGLFERRGTRWALSRRGLLLANEVLAELI